MLTAEVTPENLKKNEAALALQNRGFKVHHLGQSITIGGEKKLFEQIFSVKLVKKLKPVLPDLLEDTKTEFFSPENKPVIPNDLKSLIKEIVFPEPPDLF